MRFPFLELPGEDRPVLRPVVPVQLESLEEAPLLCLLDTGALQNRLGLEFAELAGISLDQPLDEAEILVAGIRTKAQSVRVDLSLGDVRFDTSVWFCDPWPFSFGLLGQEGFFRFFRVTMAAAEGWVECEPEAPS